MNAGIPLFVAALALIALPGDSFSQGSGDDIVIENLADPGDEGWLGVTIEDLTQPLSEELKTTTKEGAVVTSVAVNSPAEKSGLKKNDIIVAVDGHAVHDRWSLLRRIRREDPGTSVTLSIVRNNTKKEVVAVLAEARRHEFHPMPEVADLPHPPVVFFGSAGEGLRLMDLNEQLGDYFSAPKGKGVLIEEVRHDSPASEAGFKAGDVIVRIGKEPIEDTRDVWNALHHYDHGDSAQVEVLRKGTSLTLMLKMRDREEYPSGFRSGGRFPFRHDGSLEWDSREFNERMREFGEQMKDFGKDLKIQMKGLGERIREELRHIEI